MRIAALDCPAIVEAAPPVGQSLPRDLPGRDNQFNFLRLLLASLVILTHSCEIIDGNTHREILWRIFRTLTLGRLAVNGFFLVSGFLIVQSWQRSASCWEFFKKRVLRIYPAFVVASLACAFLVGPLATNPATYFSQFSPGWFSLGVLFLKAPLIPRVFIGQHYGCTNGAMWTISQEFHCYLLVPVLAGLGFVRRRRRWLGFTLAVLILAVVFPPHGPSRLRGLYWDLLLPESPEQTWRLLAFFCAGGCFCLFRDEVKYRPIWALGAALLVEGCLYGEPAASLALATAGAYVLFWFAFARVPALNFFRTHSDVSYGVYLYGWPVQSLLIRYFPDVSPWEVSAAALLVCLGIGWLSWHIVEWPFLRLKSRHAARDREALPAV